MYLRSRNMVSDGNVHNVVIRHRKNKGFLQLDDDMQETEITGDPYFSVKRSDLYLGGHEDDIFTVTDNKYNQGFNGCIYSLGMVHYRLPGMPGPEKYGQEKIPMSNKDLVKKLHNVDCTNSCVAQRPF